jgi:hypothetical protein
VSELNPEYHQEALFDLEPDPQQTLRTARAHNQNLLRELAGHGLAPNPASILVTRLELLIDLLLDDEQKVSFEIDTEKAMTGALTEMLTHARRQALTAPITGGDRAGASPGLIVNADRRR